MQEFLTYFPLPEYLLPWFYANKRDLPWRKNKDAYAVWVSEIMLQQTRVEAAKAHYIRFLKELPTVFDLANCDDDKLMKLWEGLGYYSRARNLKKCAQKVVEEYGGVFPQDKKLLEKLPGIGEYTAGAVSSIAFEQKNPAIDGNVLRVCARVEGDFTPIDSVPRKKQLYQKLQSVYPKEAGDYTQSLMELGALICLPENPKCDICPMQGRCRAQKEGWQNILPVIPKKAEKKRVKLSVFVINTPEGVALCKRPQKGVLAGMWQFPNVETDGNADITAQLSALGVQNFKITSQAEHTHVFTHLIWEMTAYRVESANVSPSFSRFSLEELKKTVSLATAFKWCLQLL
ncbi:MAG: A/G-specific adenine glycosylase [Clostridia bacterium]|nr:A/G-specific adenine glycosylase [Clostridia bacterium]